MADLSELDFTDLYVRLDTNSPSSYLPKYSATQRTMGSLQVPEKYESEIALLRGQLIKQKNDEFSLDLPNMRLRASRQVMFGDEEWVALRRIPVDVPQLAALGFQPGILDVFRRWGRRTGLIVIGGPTGAGKTTTAVALLMEYLYTYGRTAVTIEDPVEYMLQGPVGEMGRCFQIPVHSDEEWSKAVDKVLRWKPRFIFLGEVRTPVVASALLRATTSGHLAICTIHGGSVEETLGAVLQMAEREMGANAAIHLANGLCGVVHQQLVNGKPSVKVLQTGSAVGDPIRAAIRSNKIQTLGSAIQQQEAIRQQSPVDSDDESGSGTGSSRSDSSSTTSLGPQMIDRSKKSWFR